MITHILKWCAPLMDRTGSVRKWLRTAKRVLLSFLPKSKRRRTQRKGSLGIQPQQQLTSYSCTAAVAQMVTSYYDIRLGHRRAIEITHCKPDGATLPAVARALKSSHGLPHRKLCTRLQIRAALRRGEPVITNDDQTYEHDHAILLVGETTNGFWIADPAVGKVYWRSASTFFAGADEFIAVSAPNLA